MRCFRIGVLFCVLAAIALAEEGKWTPQQVLQIDPTWLKQQGLQLPASKLWDPKRGTGLLAAAVALPGCTAAFVSANGLILTNHHCLFGLIQEHSTTDNDLITNGFIAKSREQELAGKTTRITVPRKFTDVTKAVEAAIPAGVNDLARLKAIEAKQKSLVAECERTPGNRCSVAAFDGGLQYTLVEGFELTDIRLVYAPPRAVGEFGGEPDNFRWPRHTGDFAMARAYKDGKPYQSEFFYPIAKTGVKAGDFVMLMGYPGRTFRSMTADEMANERRLRFEMAKDVFGEWIGLLEQTTKGSAEGTIAVSAMLKNLNNTHTNAQGQLDGLERGKLVEKQRTADDAVVAWAAGRAAFAGALAAKQDLEKLAEARGATGARDYLYGVIGTGSVALREATSLVRMAGERAKADAEREAGYQERDWIRIRAALARDTQSFYRPSDEAILSSWLRRAQAEKITPATGLSALELFRGTKITDPSERLKMFNESLDQLRARNDSMLNLALALEPELRAWRVATDTRDGAIARLRPEWRKAVIAHAGKPVAPDANSTLRVTFGHVKGYSPRDGVMYTPQTTLAGMIEKSTGEEPFAIPPFILDAARTAKTREIPLNFMADTDTTGGNSGSPVVNGRGELVGLNFDRPWENVANDFGYNPDVARNISVDVRFLVWLLEDVQKADFILKELGLK